MIELVPIWPDTQINDIWSHQSETATIYSMTIEYYKIIGFKPPWISYFALKNGKPVGSAAFKGSPVNNRVEIAYNTFESERGKGIGTQICSQLVTLALLEDKNVFISARTLPEENHSTKILRKNSFIYSGTLTDPEDGEVWEWIYKG